MKTRFFLSIFLSGILFPACADKLSDGGSDYNEHENDTCLTINYIISPTKDHKAISDLIYGIGYYNNEEVAFKESPTFIRFGGNNTTPYNWEINCSNAGHDWYHNSYTYGGLGKETAAIWKHVIDGCIESNKTPFITIPMLYGVAADDKGNVEGNNDIHRWKKLIPRKSSMTDVPFTTTPDTEDDYVYIDESINYLTQMYGKGKVKYSLDNEPDLWTYTHSKVMCACGGYDPEKEEKVECKTFLDRTIETAKAIKDVDDQAELFGFVSYGFNGYLSFQGAPDWNSDLNNKYSWFIDYYLDRTKKASDEYGKRLVDVLDFHAYPSERGDNPINKRDVKSTPLDMKVRLQAPRRFWDSEYAKVYNPNVNQWDEWIIEYHSRFLPILPPMFASINKYNPGTKLAITEFQIGGYDDISGTIALTDVLGIYGKYGVYAANHWGTPGPNGFLAYDMFRDYDGQGGTFGNTYVKAETKVPYTDKIETSVYASIHDEDTKQLHIIVMNKNMEKTLEGRFKIEEAGVNYNTAEIYYVKGISDDEKSAGQMEKIQKDNVAVSINNNEFVYNLPKLSVAHIILKAE